MALIIEIKTVPHKEQPYDTLGYYVGHERLRFVQVSELNNPKYEFLIAIHELIEQALCLDRHIYDAAITKFDLEFKGDGEPGDDLNAPYHKEHVYASAVEYSLCKELGIDPKEYDAFLNKYIEENKR